MGGPPMKTIPTLLLTLALAAPAFAQDGAGGQTPTEMTFDDADQVEGGRTGPYGEMFQVRTRLPGRSLVRPRTQFVPELMKSVEDM